MGAVMLAAAFGAVLGAAVGVLVLMIAMPALHVRLTVTQPQLGAAVVESWLDERGLVAMPKGPDFKPARKPRSSA